MPFTFHKTSLPDVILIECQRFRDERGFFAETYKQSDFVVAGIKDPFVQDNFSVSSRGVLRGLHYQIDPQAQSKLVTVFQGEILDVAVDIRRRSPTYGRWVGIVLSGENGRMLYIPAGFAHGFCVLSETAAVTYKATAEFSPRHDRGIAWNDPAIGVDWPFRTPLLSPKDAVLPRLADADNPFV